MSYEYENINRAIVQQNGVDNNINRANSLQELDEVYAQATKADEYEAKAKAFDAIMQEWEDERMTKSHILETIQEYYDEYESGESE